MDILPLVVLLFCMTEAQDRLTLSPINLNVVRGDEARFTCTVRNSPWNTMILKLNRDSVVVISKNEGVKDSLNSNVTAEKSNEDSWVLVLKNTKKEYEGQVTCEVLGVDSQTAFLFVQEKGNVVIQGESRLAYKDSLVWFQCRAAGWFPKPLVQWQVDGKKVKQNQHSESDSSFVEVVGGFFTVTTNLTLRAVKSSHVDCLASVSALPEPLKSSINLTVVAEVLQEVGNCTDLVILSACLGVLLLLLLVCIATVLCYRRRTQIKENLQEVIRFDQPGPEGNTVAGATGGMLNLGYSSEGTNEDDAVGNTGASRQSSYASFHHGEHAHVWSENNRMSDPAPQVPDVVDNSSMSPSSRSHTKQFQQQGSHTSSVRAITTV
ncbi:immunoglobulin superfamily member 5 [Oryzias melastigma]|uniref:immunoglobulin superfamily member 5 n=1 Tax=Oryzias melastigma TaxID=30732 RepID=UPI000CF83863|nr:immunoglobulin superfamily member 5 [Oryzias melastigma]